MSEENSETSRYVIMCETSGEEMEQWYNFIRVDGNEKALKYLNDQLTKIEMYILDDLSTFELDLENTVSEQTAKEMTMVDINSYTYHRKFDGKLQYIDFKLKKRDDNEDMIEKIHNVLAFGDIDKYIDNEDKNGKEDVVDENIEDEINNTTRFLVISRDMIGRSGNDKTSIVVATKNRPGAIADLIAPFSKNKVSMTKLESRPSKMGLWEYVFFIDIEGHMNDKKVSNALKEVELNASFMKILGSYPIS